MEHTKGHREKEVAFRRTVTHLRGKIKALRQQQALQGIFLFGRRWWSRRDRVLLCGEMRDLLGAGVLGHGLGSLRHGVLGQFTGQEQTDGGLDLSAGDGAPPVVVGKP